MARTAIQLLLLLAIFVAPALADSARELRIGTSGDYAPFSLTRGGGTPAEAAAYEGLDPEIARAWAADRNLQLRFVRFRWPELLDDLAAGRFDVAMSGVTVRPERSLAGRFSVPVTTSGAVLLVGATTDARSVAEMDREGMVIAVNAGGHLERVARSTFRRAAVLPVGANASVPLWLVDGRADAVVTDSREAPHWLSAHPGLRAIGPFTRDWKAYLVAPDREALARDLDAWLLEREADGSLARLRARHLGADAASERATAPLTALLAAVDERLALMPLVAEAKRRSGTPVEVPAREAAVLEAALRAVERAAADLRAGGDAAPVPRPEAVARLYRSLMGAAKDVQRAVLARPPRRDAPAPPDLATALRPALLRIGDRIAFLIVRLPPLPDADGVREEARALLTRHGLAHDRADEIARAIVALSGSAATTDARPGAGGR